MRYYKKVGKGIESICIHKIELGIKSIKNGNRDGGSIGKDLEFFFNRLETINPEMYKELFASYCTERIAKENEIKSIHS